METIECIRQRRSVRRYVQREVDSDLLKDIISDASFAPSWKNTQISRYNIVKSESVRRKIAEEGVCGFEGNKNIILSCGALVVLSYKNGRSGFERDGSFSTTKGDRWQMFDAGAAAQSFCLAAWDRGIGTVIMGIFDEKKIAEAIGLPEEETVAALIATGYFDQTPTAPPRKSAEEITREIE